MLPSLRNLQRIPKDPDLVDQIKEKINKVRALRYIDGGQLLSLTSYFPVSNGESDIRIVYDMPDFGLSTALWPPSFWMPTIHNVLDFATYVSCFGEVDAGYMLLNYPINRSIREFSGVYVT